MERYNFQFKSSYQGESDYIVYDRKAGSETRLHWRTGLNDYLETYYNGTKEAYKRDIVASLFIVHSGVKEISKEILDAFRAFLMDEWKRQLDDMQVRTLKDLYMAEYYGKYGPVSFILKRGYWNNGWHIV